MANFYINKRKTTRHPLNINGIITISDEKNSYKENIEIINISYVGMEVVFSSNVFLMNFLKAYQDKDSIIGVNFTYETKEYSLNMEILWFRLYELGERNFYTASGLLFKNIEKEEEKVMEIILDKELENVFIG